MFGVYATLNSQVKAVDAELKPIGGAEASEVGLQDGKGNGLVQERAAAAVGRGDVTAHWGSQRAGNAVYEGVHGAFGAHVQGAAAVELRG